jgi:hypothetical protein
MLVHQNHADEGENGSIMVGIIVSLCLASKKPSELEFFVPAGTELAVKLLISFLLFIHLQCLIARNVRELFSYNRGISHLSEACHIDELNRRFVLGYEILTNN